MRLRCSVHAAGSSSSRRSGSWPFRPARRESPSRSSLQRPGRAPRLWPGSEPLKDEIPPAELSAVMAAHYKGLGFMEQYEYGEAVEAFPRSSPARPGWIRRLDQPGDRALERQRRQGRAGQESRGRDRRRQLRRSARAAGRRPGTRDPATRTRISAGASSSSSKDSIAEAHQHFKR